MALGVAGVVGCQRCWLDSETRAFCARRMRVRHFRQVGLGGVVVAFLVAASVVSGATGSLAVIETPVQATPNGARVAAGDGRVVWVTRHDDGLGAPTDVWTLRGGVAVKLTSRPDVLIPREVGDGGDHSGVLVSDAYSPATNSTVMRLLSLTTGATRALPTTRGGQKVTGAAVDHGTLYFVTAANINAAERRSALWRAAITDTSIGTATRIRQSRPGERWLDVFADRGRVAILTGRPAGHPNQGSYRREFAFGTPLGTWHRTGRYYVSGGGISPVEVAGFTQDRAALVTVRNQEDVHLAPYATITPYDRHRHGYRVRLDFSPEFGFRTLPALLPATGQLFGVGKTTDGALSVGFTGPAF